MTQLQNIPWDGSNYYMVLCVPMTDETIPTGMDVPEHFTTFKDAEAWAKSECAKYPMTYVVFQACAVQQVKKVRGKVVGTPIVWKPKGEQA